jgi:ornithine cyclodeaminase/alanine dehydrogenase-like protein (mu-crystallin family)
MHATLSYLKRGGVKAYMSSASGSKFVFVLFDADTSLPLAVMGADVLGRYRTGAASGVATRHLYDGRSGTLAVFGSGRQALTQVLGLSEVMSVEEVRVWSPDPTRRGAFSAGLAASGFKASAHESPEVALDGAQVASAITSSKHPFLTDGMLESVSHLNICGGNVPERSEVTPAAVGSFDTVVVDDLRQARVEYGDLIQAVGAGTFSWDSAVDLASVVVGSSRPHGRTLFKSGGAALEDVAVASMLYDKAKSSGRSYSSIELT